MNTIHGKPTGPAPTIKFVVSDKLTIERIGTDKPPKYASNLFRKIEP